MIRIKLNLAKIDKTAVFDGKNGAKYLDITLVDRRDQYGNDYMVTQDLGKERRLKGEKGPILGNGQVIPTVQPSRQAAKPEATQDDGVDSPY